MKLEVGMYVRTDMGDISKIKSIWENERVFFENKVDIDWFTSDSFGISYLKKCKARHNIMDLIEVGDYVNGLEVYETGIFGHNGKTFCRIYGNVAPFYNEDIKSIVTKEQFKANEYVIGE